MSTYTLIAIFQFDIQFANIAQLVVRSQFWRINLFFYLQVSAESGVRDEGFEKSRCAFYGFCKENLKY